MLELIRASLDISLDNNFNISNLSISLVSSSYLYKVK